MFFSVFRKHCCSTVRHILPYGFSHIESLQLFVMRPVWDLAVWCKWWCMVDMLISFVNIVVKVHILWQLWFSTISFSGGVSAFLPSFKNPDGVKCLSMSRPIIADSATTAELGVKTPCSCTPVAGPCQVHLFSPPGSRTFQTELTNPPMDRPFQMPVGRELDSGFSSKCVKNEKQKTQNGGQGEQRICFFSSSQCIENVWY